MKKIYEAVLIALMTLLIIAWSFAKVLVIFFAEAAITAIIVIVLWNSFPVNSFAAQPLNWNQAATIGVGFSLFGSYLKLLLKQVIPTPPEHPYIMALRDLGKK